MNNGNLYVIVPLTRVAMLASTGQLLVKVGLTFEKGDMIRIGHIEAVVEKSEAAWEYPKHNFLLTVRCEEIDQLRELLTYKL